MKISYDPGTKRVVVAFRGRITVLPDTAETEAAAIAAGERHCHNLGWAPSDKDSTRKKHFRSLF